MRGFGERPSQGIFLCVAVRIVVFETRRLEGCAFGFCEVFVGLRKVVLGLLQLLLELGRIHRLAVLHQLGYTQVGLADLLLRVLIDQAFDDGVAEVPLDALADG